MFKNNVKSQASEKKTWEYYRVHVDGNIINSVAFYTRELAFHLDKHFQDKQRLDHRYASSLIYDTVGN